LILGRSVAPCISSMTIPCISFSVKKLYSSHSHSSSVAVQSESELESASVSSWIATGGTSSSALHPPSPHPHRCSTAGAGAYQQQRWASGWRRLAIIRKRLGRRRPPEDLRYPSRMLLPSQLNRSLTCRLKPYQTEGVGSHHHGPKYEDDGGISSNEELEPPTRTKHRFWI
jgi:hypothetical protein